LFDDAATGAGAGVAAGEPLACGDAALAFGVEGLSDMLRLSVACEASHRSS